MAFVGKNGEGKSTLVKCIMNEIPFTGELRVGHNVKIGYFAQNQAQLLDGTLTVFDTIDRVAVGDMRTKVRDLLGAFMFGGEDIEKRVSVLSGGEKTRLAMIKLLLEPVNLLILDEPTNHLDMRTKDILKEAIKAFDGTVIVVSHDREFLDGLVGKVYEFGGGKVRENIGGIYDFLRSKNIDDLHQLELSAKAASGGVSNREISPAAATSGSGDASAKTQNIQTPQTPKEVRKLSYAEQKEIDKMLRKAEKNVKTAEEDVAKLEEEVAAAEAEISKGAHDQELLERYAALQKRLENRMSDWELACGELEMLNQKYKS